MKSMLALLALASFTLTGCALPPTTADNAQATPSKVASAEYDEAITGSRLPRKTSKQ